MRLQHLLKNQKMLLTTFVATQKQRNKDNYSNCIDNSIILGKKHADEANYQGHNRRKNCRLKKITKKAKKFYLKKNIKIFLIAWTKYFI